MNAFKRHAGFTRHVLKKRSVSTLQGARRPRNEKLIALAKSQRDLEFIIYGKQEY